MGTDIHFHIEVKIDGVWHHYACPTINRNYAIFYIMAGVRESNSRNAYLKTISEPKGLPDNITKITEIDVNEWDTDAHSTSWLSLTDIKMLEDELNKLELDLEHDVLRCYFFGNAFSDLMGKPYDGIEDIRFIFWFDN